MSNIVIEGKKINITNPDKVLFNKPNITKAEYIESLIKISQYLLPHTADKALTAIRYPNGIGKPFFYQKRPPKNTPEWIEIIKVNDDEFINLNSLETLVFLANSAVIEFHVPFCKYNEEKLTSLVFDLDPPDGKNFKRVADCALKIHDTLKGLGIVSYVKTSGATGLQIYIPIKHIIFEKGRELNVFFAKYFIQKFPKLMTIERLKKNRMGKLYFDYLQMAKGKNMIAVYSPRAVSCAAVSMPVTWNELDKGINQCDFNILNADKRLKQNGDLFKDMINGNSKNSKVIHSIYKSIKEPL